MKKFFVLTFLLFGFSFPDNAWGSSATAVAETEVEAGDGQTQVHQVVETTVNGQTVKKESNQPGKLELKMEKRGEGQPTVTFSQESSQIITSPTPQPEADRPLDETSTSPFVFISPIIDFVRKLLDVLTSLFK